MEKKHHFQGFRKFSIKTRLVIALLMISIIPLVGISGYSFHIIFRGTSGEAFCIYFPDPVYDQSEYGK